MERSNEKLTAVIEKYSDMVKRISFMYIKNHIDADDIMQEVFIKYMLRGGTFENEMHEKSWIILVTVNKCKDYLKSYWKQNISSIGDREFQAPEEEESGVMDYVRQLPKQYKIYIYLFYYENYSVPEISKMMNVNRNTIYSGLHRARALLREYMGGDTNGQDTGSI